jgi:hypothetical protein
MLLRFTSKNNPKHTAQPQNKQASKKTVAPKNFIQNNGTPQGTLEMSKIVVCADGVYAKEEKSCF